MEFLRRCACSDPGGRRRREKSAAVALHKGGTGKKTDNVNYGTVFFPFHLNLNLQQIHVRGNRSFGPAAWSRSRTSCSDSFPAGPLLPYRPQINHIIYSYCHTVRETGRKWCQHELTVLPIYDFMRLWHSFVNDVLLLISQQYLRNIQTDNLDIFCIDIQTF